MYGKRFLATTLMALLVQSTTSASAATFETTFVSSERERLSCQIASDIRDNLSRTSRSYKEQWKLFDDYLASEVSSWVMAYQVSQPLIGGSQLLFKNTAYFLPFAFALAEYSSEDPIRNDNYLGAYAYLAEKLEIDYRNGTIGPYSMAQDPSLIPTLKKMLAQHNGETFPTYKDSEGNPISATYNCRKSEQYHSTCLVQHMEVGDSNHPQHPKLIKEFQRLNRFASPLFLWLLQQPNSSVSYSRLYEEAVKLYPGNPWQALGAIAWITLVDSHRGSRIRGAIVASKLRPVLNDPDLAGHNYHFWGYTLHAMRGRFTTLRFRTMAAANEKWLPALNPYAEIDHPDWAVDRMAFDFGARIRRASLGSATCGR